MEDRLAAAVKTFELRLWSILTPPYGTVEELNAAVRGVADPLADSILEDGGIRTDEPNAAKARELLVAMLGLEIIGTLRRYMIAAIN